MVVWLSANKFGYELLHEALTRGILVKAIITLAEDSTTIMYDSVSREKWQTLGKEKGIPVYEVARLNEELALLKNIKPEFLVVCGWRQVLSKEALSIATRGTVGFHPTLLPQGRGPAPIINTLLQGWKESGVTLFYLGEGLDDGDIIGQIPFAIEETDHALDVYEKVTAAGKNLVQEYFPKLLAGLAPRIHQQEKNAVVFPKPKLAGNKLDLVEPLPALYAKIKALSHPYQGAYIEKNGYRLRLWQATLEKINDERKER